MEDQGSIVNRAWVLSRRVALALIAGAMRRWRSEAAVIADFDARPVRVQVAIVGTTLSLLLVLALISALFGWIGICLYFLAVIVVVN